jgi:hypothetical protein
MLGKTSCLIMDLIPVRDNDTRQFSKKKTMGTTMIKQEIGNTRKKVRNCIIMYLLLFVVKSISNIFLTQSEFPAL